MAKILIIAGIVFYIIHRYFSNQPKIKDSTELKKQFDARAESLEIHNQKETIELQNRIDTIEIKRQKETVELERQKEEKAKDFQRQRQRQRQKEIKELERQKEKETLELKRQKEAIESQKYKDKRELKIQKAAIEFAERILERIKKKGGLDYSIGSIYYYYNKKLNDFTDEITTDNLENTLMKAGKQELLNQIKYGFKYLYRCPECKSITDVQKSERNHVHDKNKYLSNGRYTKDGTLDERYHTEFKIDHTYYFDADCTFCNCNFQVELCKDGFKAREKL